MAIAFSTLFPSSKDRFRIDRNRNVVHRHEPPVTSTPVKVILHDVEREFIVVDKPGSIASAVCIGPASFLLSLFPSVSLSMLPGDIFAIRWLKFSRRKWATRKFIVSMASRLEEHSNALPSCQQVGSFDIWPHDYPFDCRASPSAYKRVHGWYDSQRVRREM